MHYRREFRKSRYNATSLSTRNETQSLFVCFCFWLYLDDHQRTQL